MAKGVQPVLSKLVPLRGAAQFSSLMRQKPQASWDLCLVHACANVHGYERGLNNEPDLFSSPPSNADHHVDHLIQCQVGQIIPKKAYKHAVDRNRVRRLVRAHSLSTLREYGALETPTHITNIQLLFRVKAIDKKTRAAGLIQQANPHTQAFSDAVLAGIQLAFKRVLKKTPT
jgi:ribonuclease P protein component